MSHFAVVVCLDNLNDLEAALAPYDENKSVEPYRDHKEGAPRDHWAVRHLRDEQGLNPDDSTLTWTQVAETYNASYPDDDRLLVDESGQAYTLSTYNPDSKWDYWRIGGRWGGYFIFRDEHAGAVIEPQRGWDSPEVIMPKRCDGGPKAALDLDALRAAKTEEARKTYAEFHAAVAGTPEVRPWSDFIELVDSAPGYTIGQARSEYHSQPRVQALHGTDFLWYADPIATYQQPEALYVEWERARAVPGYAVLTLDGKWMAPGRMGWWGISSDTESDRAGYLEVANAYIDSLPNLTWLVVVDCHI